MKRIVTVVIMAALGIMLLTGCNSGSSVTKGSDDPPVPVINKNVGLKHFASREEMQTFIKDRVTNDMEDALNGKLEDPCSSYDDYIDMETLTSGSSSEGGDSQGISFTNTNVQEEGVDESDIFKFDGSRVYMLQDGKLRIVQAWPIENFKELSTLDIEGAADSLYLYNNRVIVISTGITLVSNRVTLAQDTYTKVTIIDVSDPAAPNVLRISYYEGDYKGSRMINGDVYLIIYDYMVLPSIDNHVSYELLPECDFNDDTKEVPSAEMKAAVEELRARNLAEIAKWEMSEDLFNAIRTKLGNDELKDVSLDFDSFSASDVAEMGGVAGIIRIKTTDVTVADQKEYVMGNVDTVYATKNSIYLAGSEWGEDTKTYIHRFALNANEAKATYFGSNEVNGWLLNQFSLGEYNGYLRVAFTNGQANKVGEGVESSVAIIDSLVSNIPIVGSVSGIGNGEEIKAVRFIGDKGYVVTFKKVDPLFVLDLSEPAVPKVAGELKIPGFSTYLHPLDDDHLIGLGKDAEDQGDFAWFQGLKLSIFDITDSSAPKEDSSLIIGSRGTMSPAFEDHLAFTYDASKGLLALPLSLCEGSGGGSDLGSLSYDGVQVYGVSAETGFNLKGELIDPTYSSDVGDYGICNGWYFEGSVQRTVIVGSDSGNHIVTIENDGLSIYKENGEKEKSIVWPIEEGPGSEMIY